MYLSALLRIVEYSKQRPWMHVKVWFFCFRPEIPFLGKFDPNQNCQFKLKFAFFTNSNMQNSMVMFTFPVLNQKYPFWVNLLQKVKIPSLSWNLVLKNTFTSSSFRWAFKKRELSNSQKRAVIRLIERIRKR